MFEIEDYTALPPSATPAQTPGVDRRHEDVVLAQAESDYLNALDYTYGINRVQIDLKKARELFTAAAAVHFPEAEAELAVIAMDAGEREKLAIQLRL